MPNTRHDCRCRFESGLRRHQFNEQPEKEERTKNGNHLRHNLRRCMAKNSTSSIAISCKRNQQKKKVKWKMNLWRPNGVRWQIWWQTQDSSTFIYPILPLSFLDLFPLFFCQQQNASQSYRGRWWQRETVIFLDSINHCSRLESQPQRREEYLLVEPPSRGKTHKPRAQKRFISFYRSLKLFLSPFKKQII